MIKYSQTKKLPLSTYFKHFLGFDLKNKGLAFERKKIAITNKEEDAEKFGVSRIEIEKHIGYTPIGVDKYKDLNASLLNLFLQLKTKLIQTQNQYYIFKDIDSHGLIDESDLQCITADANLPGLSNKEGQVFKPEEFLKRNKLYRLKLQLNLDKELKNFTESTRIYFSINKIQEKMLCKSFNKLKSKSDNGKNPITSSGNLYISIIHTNPGFIQKFLEKASLLWQEAIEWDQQDLNMFKEILGRYCYILAHAMPFQRGSAAILKWTLKAICLHHNYNINLESGEWEKPDEIALSVPLINDFIDKFKREVIIDFIKEKEEEGEEKKNLQDQSSDTEIRQNSRKEAENKGIIGPKEISGWELHDVNDEGNCFYEAIAHQMEKLSYPLEVHETTKPWDLLRLRVQGKDFKDEEWADNRSIDEFAKKFPDTILAIINTITPTNGFVCYYYDSNEGLVKTLHPQDEGLSLPEGRTIIRLAATGNHFLSVKHHPQLAVGHITEPFNLPN